MLRALLALGALLALATTTHAHDTWVQTNTNLVRTGDLVHVDLMLGNHGNDHRDYRLASKLDPARATLDVLSPDGKRYDLKPNLTDTGYMPKEGFWTARFVAGRAGLHCVAHTVDSVFRTKRTIKSGKTYFLVSDQLDNPEVPEAGFEQPLGHALEIVPVTNPVAPLGPGQTITVELLYHGKPRANERVSFIPRSATLAEDFDPRYERTTDAKGRASFEPTEGDYHLIVAHVTEPDEQGAGYELTKYSATLVVYVPQLCPCCD